MRSTGATSVNLPGWRDLYLTARSNLEWIAAALVAGTLTNWRGLVGARFASNEWSVGDFYSAVFDWSSIQAAFLFGVYAFFLSRSEPFIQAIAGSQPFRQLREYVVRTLYLSMTLTVLSLPFLIAAPPISPDGNGLGYVVFCGLSSLLTFTFFSFLKVIRVFGKIERRS